MKSLLADAKQKISADPIITARLAYFAEPFNAMFREADDGPMHTSSRWCPTCRRKSHHRRQARRPRLQHAAALSFFSEYDREHPQVNIQRPSKPCGRPTASHSPST